MSTFMTGRTQLLSLARNWWALLVRGVAAILLGILAFVWPCFTVLALVGVASVVFAALILIFPGEGAVAILWAIGAYAIVFGSLLIALGFRQRALRDRLSASPG